ncbi:MAG TPA: nuclear transport factor 2 family protein [Acidimicrobiales bacterium]|nr:nuclear transport factor 2 family protein [Acidimicrobiales bacterium]
MTASDRAIENLIGRYAELVDAGDFDGVAELLADAALGAIGEEGSVRGRHEIGKLFHTTTMRHDDGTPRTKHVTTNTILEVDEAAGTATARSYFTVLQAMPGMALQPIVAGRYHDRFARVDGAWRFSERRFGVDLMGDVSRHLFAGAPPST